MDFKKKGYRLISGLIKSYFLIGFIAVIMITAMGYSFYCSSQMINKYSPLVDATMEIKLEATTAHLWFEEIIAGDRNENLADIIAHIDMALWYANAMLEGGENQEGLFIKLSDEALITEVKATIEQLNEFKRITFSRYKAKEFSGAGSAIDQQYDKLFNNFIAQIDNVETQLQQKIKQDFNQYKAIEIGFILIVVILSLCGFIIQFRHDRALANNLLTINKARDRAEKKEQWLSIIMNSMGDGVITTDFVGNVTRINPAAEKLTGWMFSECKGLPLKSIFPIVDASTGETIENPVDKVIATGETVYLSNHTTLIAKDGTEYQIGDSAAPIRDAENNILGMVLVFNDVTEKYHNREQLRRSQQRLSLHWQETPLGIIEWNPGFEFVDLNPAAEKIFGFSKGELLGRHASEKILPKSARPAVNLICQQLLDNTGGRRSRNENLTKDGKIILCEWYNTALVNDDGEVIGISSLIMDVTESQKLEDKLRLSSRVFTETKEGIMVTDAKANIIDVNPAFCEITGYSYKEIIGKNSNILGSGKQSSEFYTNMKQTLNEYGYWQGELWNRTKQGTVYAELLSISSILDEDENVLQYVGIFTDITASKEQQETLEQMAHYDVLTQLPNRVLLADRFIHALAHSKRNKTQLAVCFLDLDNFKPVNDTYGHEIGDQLLVEVSRRIQLSIREEDTVSRQGGDEFVLLLGDIESFYQCEKMLKRVLESLAKPYRVEQQVLLVSASIGVSLYPSDNCDLDTLIRHADQAMYLAKQAGKNQYHFFDTEQEQQIVQKNVRLKEIERALFNDEFDLYYQPKVNMATGSVFGAEALIRWLHPEKGVIPPLEFLPIIEGTHLEVLIGNWVIRRALKQLASWDEQGIDLEVSINISSYHLRQPSFIDDLAAALALFPMIDSQSVQLEILESSALGDLKSINNILESCVHVLGVNVALDDFGTGYSSLTHLRNLPAKTIKIDQTFVRDLLDDPDDHAIIEGLIGLTNAFNRVVIAEGVETTEHGLMLLILGCNEAQGYGIAKPMPVLDLQNWLRMYTPNQRWLACANKVRTAKENKQKSFKLTLTQWYKQFKNNINSTPDNIGQWPILKRTKCHCGVWVKKEIGEYFFEESWPNELNIVHNKMHDVADELFKQYYAGDIKQAIDGLINLQLAVEQMEHIFEQGI